MGRKGTPGGGTGAARRRRGAARRRGAEALVAVGLALSAVAAVGCGACGTDGGDREDAGLDAGDGRVDEGTAVGDWVRLGTGFEEFVPLHDGDTVELEAGCQGGHHLWASLEAREPGTLRSPLVAVSYARVRDGVVVSNPFEVRVSFEAVPGGDTQRVLGLQIVATDLDEVRDEEIDFRVRVTTRDGRVAEDAVRVRAVLGPVGCGAEPG
jgi:hypothetical protein